MIILGMPVEIERGSAQDAARSIIQVAVVPSMGLRRPASKQAQSGNLVDEAGAGETPAGSWQALEPGP